MTNILIVDDEENICFAFSQCVRQLGHTPYTASTAAEGLALIRKTRPAVVFLDNRLPGESGLDLLKRIHEDGTDAAIVIMTAFGTMDTAIDAVKMGAYEYLTKPVNLDHVEQIIQRVVRQRDRQAVSVIPDDTKISDPDQDMIIGSTEAIADIYKMIGLLTTNTVPVLIEGESGVGKELVARAIHYRSKRKNCPFVAINCGAMPDTLLESELFGHEKGAFTGADKTKIGKFEYAKGGTIFLDEIGDLKFSMQIKLLRVLQEKIIVRVGGLESISVDSARVITATNKNLFEEMNAGRFRRDLYYRLQMITLKIPPLRERKEDIPQLVAHFIQKANQELGRDIKGIETEALDMLKAYHWPGNARELENVIKRGAIFSRGNTIGSHNIMLADSAAPSATPAPPGRSVADQVDYWFENREKLFPDEKKIYSTLIATVGRTLIQKALETCNNNQLRASELLGMNRTTLRNKIKEFNL